MKLLIVDDQMSVVEGLKRGVNWKAMGFSEVDTAYNAVDARASLRNSPVDVMLCDIEMPMESGLELLAWMRAQGMQTRCIFLTAHTKFNYAQEAVRLGGFDYIIQPAPYSEIGRAVAKAAKDVLSSREQVQLQQMGKAFHQQELAIAANVLRGFLRLQPNGRDVTTLENLGILPLRSKLGYIVLLHIVQWKDGVEPWVGPLMTVAIGNMAKEMFEPHGELSVISFMDDDSLVLLLQNTEGEEMSMESVVQQLMFLKSVCEEYIHCSMACYLDEPILLADAPEHWEKLKVMRDDNVSLRAGVFQVEEKSRIPHTFRVPQIRGWSALLKEGYTEAMEKEGVALLDKLVENHQLDAATLRAFYQDFLQMIYFTLKGSEDKMHEMFHRPEDLELYRNGMKSVYNMKNLLHHVAVNFTAPVSVNDQKTLVDKVQRYINEHLEGELRRDELAEYVHLNPDYLTRIFKKETGFTIKEYVIRQKLEEARNLLRVTSLPISFIAAKVGYCNFSHFSYTYKKVLGITPQEERQGVSDN